MSNYNTDPDLFGGNSSNYKKYFSEFQKIMKANDRQEINSDRSINDNNFIKAFIFWLISFFKTLDGGKNFTFDDNTAVIQAIVNNDASKLSVAEKTKFFKCLRILNESPPELRPQFKAMLNVLAKSENNYETYKTIESIYNLSNKMDQQEPVTYENNTNDETFLSEDAPESSSRLSNGLLVEETLEYPSFVSGLSEYGEEPSNTILTEFPLENSSSLSNRLLVEKPLEYSSFASSLSEYKGETSDTILTEFPLENSSTITFLSEDVPESSSRLSNRLLVEETLEYPSFVSGLSGYEEEPSDKILTEFPLENSSTMTMIGESEKEIVQELSLEYSIKGSELSSFVPYVQSIYNAFRKFNDEEDLDSWQRIALLVFDEIDGIYDYFDIEYLIQYAFPENNAFRTALVNALGDRVYEYNYNRTKQLLEPYRRTWQVFSNSPEVPYLERYLGEELDKRIHDLGTYKKADQLVTEREIQAIQTAFDEYHSEFSIDTIFDFKNQMIQDRQNNGSEDWHGLESLPQFSEYYQERNARDIKAWKERRRVAESILSQFKEFAAERIKEMKLANENKSEEEIIQTLSEFFINIRTWIVKNGGTKYYDYSAFIEELHEIFDFDLAFIDIAIQRAFPFEKEDNFIESFRNVFFRYRHHRYECEAHEIAKCMHTRKLPSELVIQYLSEKNAKKYYYLYQQYPELSSWPFEFEVRCSGNGLSEYYYFSSEVKKEVFKKQLCFGMYFDEHPYLEMSKDGNSNWIEGEKFPPLLKYCEMEAAKAKNQNYSESELKAKRKVELFEMIQDAHSYNFDMLYDEQISLNEKVKRFAKYLEGVGEYITSKFGNELNDTEWCDIMCRAIRNNLFCISDYLEFIIQLRDQATLFFGDDNFKQRTVSYLTPIIDEIKDFENSKQSENEQGESERTNFHETSNTDFNKTIPTAFNVSKVPSAPSL